MGIVIPTNFSFIFWGFAVSYVDADIVDGYCRMGSRSDSDKGSEGTDYTKIENIGSVTACENACNGQPSCLAYDYNIGAEDCELWTSLPTHVSEANAVCKIKNHGQ
eukprot:Awhi_evm1s11090